MAKISSSIADAVQLLHQGEVVAIPTETVYGLAANALNAEAVVKIFEAKQRPRFDPLIVHVASFADAEKYATDIPPLARQLAKKFWPGPLTLLLPKASNIPDVVTSGLPTVGLRCPAHEATLSLLQQLPFPLAAPSANPFGYVSPTTPQHVDNQLGKRIPLILDGGRCKVGLESTIVQILEGETIVHRLGGLAVEDIEEITGPVKLVLNHSSNPLAPGQLTSHYAPTKRIILGELASLWAIHKGPKTAVISFQNLGLGQFNRALSASGSLVEAAQNIFQVLRELDSPEIDLILAEKMPDKGIGRAINDRLLRAATGGLVGEN